MVVVAFSQTDKVIGTLTNGMKIVSTTVTFSDANFGTATTVYIKPLMRVIGFISGGNKTAIASALNTWAAHATIPNGLTVTPTASTNAGIAEVISFGY